MNSFLLDLLPPAALPGTYHEHAVLPRLRSGKINRLALAERSTRPGQPGPGLLEGEAPDSPRTPTERIVAQLWQELLATGPLGRSADYFDLGGQSLLTMRMIARVRQHFGGAGPGLDGVLRADGGTLRRGRRPGRRSPRRRTPDGPPGREHRRCRAADGRRRCLTAHRKPPGGWSYPGRTTAPRTPPRAAWSADRWRRGPRRGGTAAAWS
ncbi:phosphopantetheine-binding protein [Streptomyces sp. NPDC007083]|uniref:phosphopantetheine-binding protein n=1 Tax=unclassified Streptomyces TaxID=2593676 RepID=UPI0033E330D1